MSQERNVHVSQQREEAGPDLLAATRGALEKFGLAGATLERIAGEAGLSRVTLHRRGVTKDGLLAELVARATDDYRAALWPALTSEGTGADRLAIALAAVCAQAEAQMALLVALRARSDSIFHREDEGATLTRSVFTEPLEQLLREGARDGSLREVDPLETATILFNLVGWTYLHMRTGHAWQPKRAQSAVIDLALNGIQAGATA